MLWIVCFQKTSNNSGYEIIFGSYAIWHASTWPVEFSAVAHRRAEGERSRAPNARAAGADRSPGRGLTMPPLSAEMLETFAAEALAPGELEQLRASGAVRPPFTDPHATAPSPSRRAGAVT